MKYPTHVTLPDGSIDLLCYHRLTGLQASTALMDVAYLVRKGFTLLAPEYRRDEEGNIPETFGVEPVDRLAGDGAAVFFTPVAPVSIVWGGGRRIDRYPGVAFRLSTLLRLSEVVTYRPADAQTVYLQGLSEYKDLVDSLPSVSREFADAGWLAESGQGGEFFEEIRRQFEMRISTSKDGERILAGGEVPPKQNAKRLVAGFLETIDPVLEEAAMAGEDVEGERFEMIKEFAQRAAATVLGAIEGAWGEVSDTQEVVAFAEGGIPLAEAEFMFNNERVVALVDRGAPAEAGLEGLSDVRYLTSPRVHNARARTPRLRGVRPRPRAR